VILKTEIYGLLGLGTKVHVAAVKIRDHGTI